MLQKQSILHALTKVKLSALLAGAAIAPWLLTVTGLPSTAQPLEAAAKDEVFGVTSVINLPDSQKLGAFDISFVDPANGVYLLADRTNASIDVADTSTNTLTHQLTAPAPGFAVRCRARPRAHPPLTARGPMECWSPTATRFGSVMETAGYGCWI